MAVRGKRAAANDPSYRNLKADYYPVQRKTGLASASNGVHHVCDVGRILSRVNHRLYRQGKTYQVKIDLDNRTMASGTPSGAGQIEVYALKDTWFTQKAWQLARATYLTATAGERAAMSSSKIARWEDFRVSSGVSNAIDVNPYEYASDLSGNANTHGEHATSQITLADGSTERSFTWGTPGGGSQEFGILVEYNKSGDTNKSPQDDANTGAGDQAYAGSEDGVFEKQMDDLVNNGNHPPYNRASFSSSVWVKIATLDNSDAAGPGVAGGHSRMSTGFFNAPCGLVVLKTSVARTLAGEVSITAKAGDYKGVAAMQMGV